MNVVKRQVANLFQKLGYELIPHWLMADYEKAKLLKSVFAFHRIDGVIDVGGNVGQYRDFIRRDVEFRGPIVTFEPVAALARQLAARAKAENDSAWTIEGYALGRSEGELELNVTQDTAFASFRQPRAVIGLGTGSTGFESQMSVTERQKTSIKRLDDVLPKAMGPVAGRKLFLKIDTQGFDLEVLGGADGIMPAVVAIQIEVSFIPIYEGTADAHATLDALKRLGFHASGLYPISRDKNLRAIEFDCILVR